MKILICLLLSIVASFVWASSTEQAQLYQNRYQLNSKNQKLVDNFGEGYEDLYGVRNFRAVLRGIIYRGGANNAYNKNGKRANQNPLPEVGLKSLCEEGFKSAVYLYSTNFSTASKAISCLNFAKQKNQLDYKQISGLNVDNEKTFLEMIYKAIKGQIPSPIYLHCWNGWHASGLVSTLALRQFCGLTAEQGLAYWTENTDTHSTGYEIIKTRIKNFKPLPQLQISELERREICIEN